MSAIDDLANGYVDDLAALDPCAATALGILGHDDELTDYSPEGIEARAQLRRRVLGRLDRTEVTSHADRITAALLRERTDLELEIHDAGLWSSDLNVVESPLQDIRQVFDLMPTGDQDAWAAIARRMSAVPEALAGYRRSLAESSRRGSTSARRQVLKCASRCDDWAGTSRDGFFFRLAERHAEGPLRAGLDRAAAAASDALTGFGRFLREELLPAAPGKDAVGRERYSLWSRYFTGTRLDLEETYAWACQELARIEQEMRDAAARIVPRGTVADAIAFLDADPTRRIAGAEPFRAWMQDLSDRTIAALAGVHFDIPAPIRQLECCIAPTRDGGIYYTPPAEDFSRPGRMWWAVPKGVDSFTTWREVTTVFHEGVPGHHLQVAQVVFLADLLNRYRRVACWISGHGEGWALYAERLMAELGHLDDPGDRLGMLDAQSLRAARVILDVGLHLELPVPAGVGLPEGARWTPELGWDFLRAHSSMAEPFLRDELDRYLGWPGQAASYKVGERAWLAAREAARRRHGAAFDLKAFHAAALDLGSMGLDLLQEELARL